jgi:DNA-binding NarL/FixJ family response regulator
VTEPLPDPPPGPMLRLVLAEDHYLVREGTRQLLELSGRVEVVAAVGTADELLDVVRRDPPDVVVTDIRMPPTHGMEGIEAALTIRAEHPSIGVVVLSNHADEAYARALFVQGTAGLAYLLKERVGDLEELMRAVTETRAGRSVVDPVVVDALVRRGSQQDRPGLSELTPREREVLGEMAAGRSNTAIASAVHLSRSAVEKNVNSIFSKLGLVDEPSTHRRVAAVVTFLAAR